VIVAAARDTHAADAAAARDARWRAELLRAAGLSPELARAVAAGGRHDVHRLVRLLEQGCPLPTALRLIAPIERMPGT